eukprot:2323271-Pleurochrysis_carterae.AAC.2
MQKRCARPPAERAPQNVLTCTQSVARAKRHDWVRLQRRMSTNARSTQVEPWSAHTRIEVIRTGMAHRPRRVR